MMLFQLAEIVCGALLLVAPFTPRYRREAPRWILLITFLAGLLCILYATSGAYLDSIRVANEPAYMRFRPLRSFVGGIAVGFATSVVLYSLSKRANRTEPG
jgi:amino acid transporter